MNWRTVAVTILDHLRGQAAMNHRDEARHGQQDDYDRSAPHPREGKVPVNKGGYAFATRHVWVCECRARGQGSLSTQDAERLAQAHVLKKSVHESHSWHLEQEYPPREGWFQPDGNQW